MVFHHCCDGHMAWNPAGTKMKETQTVPPKSSQSHIFFPPDVIKGRTADLKTFIYLNIFPDPSPHSP